MDGSHGRGHLPPSPPVTELLLAWGGGDESALDQLVPLIHAELHRLARRHMRGERKHHTLQTTALVNEAFLRLINLKRVRWQDRAHFFAMSARLMRRVLVDHARSRQFRKRGGGAPTTPFDDASVPVERSVDFVALDDALQALAAIDPRKAKVVEMRFFAGLSVDETAAALRVSPETVMRDWRVAKAWLHRELQGRDGR
jgi:RNA polymerase sigma-70 factor (ECF subfamily)